MSQMTMRQRDRWILIWNLKSFQFYPVNLFENDGISLSALMKNEHSVGRMRLVHVNISNILIESLEFSECESFEIFFINNL